MRTVLLSDIHGNHLALRKVLVDIGNRSQQIVCLGDVAWHGPQPSQAIRELKRLAVPMVMGNTDEYLIGGHRHVATSNWHEIGHWCREALTDEDVAFVRTFKETIEVNIGAGVKLLGYHGSPRSNNESIYPTTPDDELETIFESRVEGVFAGGHTHSQMFRRFGDRLVINPGSVGMPFDSPGQKGSKSPPWAEYAILDCGKEGLSVTMKRVGYDVEELAEVAAKSGMPHSDWWMKGWIR